MLRAYSAGVVLVVAGVLVNGCGSNSSPTSPTPATKPSARMAVAAMQSTTAVQSDGALWYETTLTLQETGGVAATLGAVTFTVTRPSGLSTANGGATDVFPSTRIAANGMLAGGVRITSSSKEQATSIRVQIAYSDDDGHTGTIQGTTDVVPAQTSPGCTAPGTPTSLAVSVSGTTATFSWTAPNAGGPVVNYAVNLGTSPGASNVDSRTAATTAYTLGGLSNGTYYARVQARNDCAASTASNEVVFTIGSGTSAPPTSWAGSLPGTSGSASHPVCSQALPNPAYCVNDLFGRVEALCQDRAFSCSTGSGTCSGHGGVYCWRQ